MLHPTQRTQDVCGIARDEKGRSRESSSRWRYAYPARAGALTAGELLLWGWYKSLHLVPKEQFRELLFHVREAEQLRQARIDLFLAQRYFRLCHSVGGILVGAALGPLCDQFDRRKDSVFRHRNEFVRDDLRRRGIVRNQGFLEEAIYHGLQSSAPWVARDPLRKWF